MTLTRFVITLTHTRLSENQVRYDRRELANSLLRKVLRSRACAING